VNVLRTLHKAGSLMQVECFFRVRLSVVQASLAIPIGVAVSTPTWTRLAHLVWWVKSVSLRTATCTPSGTSKKETWRNSRDDGMWSVRGWVVGKEKCSPHLSWLNISYVGIMSKAQTWVWLKSMKCKIKKLGLNLELEIQTKDEIKVNESLENIVKNISTYHKRILIFCLK